jgi:uncharacterized protein
MIEPGHDAPMTNTHKPVPAAVPVSDGAHRERTDPKSLELLVCPLTKTTLEYDEARQELISRRANLAYPIRSGVPLLTRDAARNLDDKPV